MTKKLKEALSYISKIHEAGNRFIIESLNKNGIKGLVPSHGDVLAVLYNEGGKSTMKKIADKIHRTKPTVTILVDKLEKLGYVKREESKKDGRYTYIILTEKGKEFEPIFEKISRKLNKILYKNFSAKECETLDNLLERAVINLRNNNDNNTRLHKQVNENRFFTNSYR